MYTRHLVVWVVWLGLIMIGLEARILHADVYAASPWAWTPFVFCLAGGIIIPAGMLRRTLGVRRVVEVYFILGVFVGLFGVYAHTGFRLEPFANLLTGGYGGEGAAPLPPASISGLCLIGFLALRVRVRKPQWLNGKQNGAINHGR